MSPGHFFLEQSRLCLPRLTGYFPQGRFSKCLLIALTLALAALAPAAPVEAQSRNAWQVEDAPLRHVTLTLFKSKTFHLDKVFTTAVVGSPEIADVFPLSDRSLYILGKKVGTTNVSVYDQNQKLAGVIDLDVTIDSKNLEQKINSSTGTRGIHVSSMNGQVILSGEAANAVAAARAMAVAKAMSPNGVVNAMSIGTAQQVLLKVRFIEASRDAGRAIGVNWFASNRTGTAGFNTGQGGFINNTPNNTGPGGVPLFQTAGTLAGVSSQP
ncbi:MAG TPA: pilus assembly protein N-terminal domain-containing protein, partial [Pseudolabrys sp.]|nr:pilus assembly protein N-terminal domain-containing protein [Pseudolabrys sp.]